MVMLASAERVTETQGLTVLTIKAPCDPGTIARIVNVFTQSGLIPAFLSCHRADPYLLIDVQLAREDSSDGEILLEKLRALVCVDRANCVSGRK